MAVELGDDAVGVGNDDGRDGEAAGLQVVMDRCLKVDHARLLG